MINEKTTSLIHKLAEEGIVPGVSYAMIKDGYVQSEVLEWNRWFRSKEIDVWQAV